MNAFRDIRVIPVVLVAVLGLAVLKIAGLVMDGGYVFDYKPNSTKASWAQDHLNFPGAPKNFPGAPRIDSPDVTGSVHGAPKEAPEFPSGSHRPSRKPMAVVYRTMPQASEAILERLQARRQEPRPGARDRNPESCWSEKHRSKSR